MDLAFTEAEQSFRDEVGQFLSHNVPPDLRRKLGEGCRRSKDERAAGVRILDRSALAPCRGSMEVRDGPTLVQHYVFAEEVRAFRAWTQFGYGGLVRPVIYTFGKEAQKKYCLPRIVNAGDWWCQGFSEPGAGSDLASRGP
ncbi:hypothetical protein HCN58_35180 [Bradyrhizobium sp. WSM 1791]|uniref:Acyl-CoA dehydrogenase/oxidase N-terminal domain-containing protein n=1 Tax=Bradyrhizobium australiense TaxID=2721161 RepID=A0A7Y4GZ36_9BRAD|nr:hypothetical protein [Bradyrhizobium australiense]